MSINLPKREANTPTHHTQLSDVRNPHHPDLGTLERFQQRKQHCFARSLATTTHTRIPHPHQTAALTARTDRPTIPTIHPRRQSIGPVSWQKRKPRRGTCYLQYPVVNHLAFPILPTIPVRMPWIQNKKQESDGGRLQELVRKQHHSLERFPWNEARGFTRSRSITLSSAHQSSRQPRQARQKGSGCESRGSGLKRPTLAHKM